MTVTPEGTWTPLANQSPESIGLMMLLSDGTVAASGNNNNNGNNTWYRLTPDSQGHYANGTWSALPSMEYTRLFMQSQILPSGKVYISGGEYGNAPAGSAEMYDPVANSWSALSNATSVDSQLEFVDGESMMLNDGNLFVYAVLGDNCPDYTLSIYLGDPLIYSPSANTFTAAPCTLGNLDESSFVKLPDGSILALDLSGTTSERYIPATGQWIADAVPPAYIFNVGGEVGGAFLLPNGNVFYIGGTNQTLLYTPSGSTAPGAWTLGPTFPNENNDSATDAPIGANDAPAAIMVNGNVLMAEGGYLDPCSYCGPTYFFVYDYQTNTITSIKAPNGATLIDQPPFVMDMLDLPDGTVLLSPSGTQFYTFTPATPQIQAGEPVINSVTLNSDSSYLLTGTGFNGISMGADYGDENQNATNYPIASLTDNSGNVYYARTYNWSSTGVSTGSEVVTTDMTLPAGLPGGTYQLTVSANGIQSAPVTFSPVAVSLSANSLTYGLQAVSTQSTSQKVTLTNTGSATLTIGSITVTGPDASSFVFANTCGSTLAAGANCLIHGHFAPVATGALTASIQITDDAPGSPQTISLSGTGLGTSATLSATSLSYNSVTVNTPSGSQSVTLTNTGNKPLSIGSIAVTGTNASDFTFANNCGTSLAAVATCSIHGHFTPSILAAESASVTITDNAPGSPQSIALSGTGVAAPDQVTLSSTNLLPGSTPTNLVFGSIDQGSWSASQTVIMTNTGTTTLSITSIAVGGVNMSQFVFANSCGASLAPGANCSIHGHFQPTATGPMSASITIADSDTTSPQTIALSGTGVTPAITLSTGSLSYPPTTVGTSSGSQSVTMTNVGGSTLTITSIVVTGTDASSFVFANNCGSSLAIGASCTIHGHFAPTAQGPMNAAVTIISSSPGSPESITLSGTGQ